MKGICMTSSKRRGLLYFILLGLLLFLSFFYKSTHYSYGLQSLDKSHTSKNSEYQFKAYYKVMFNNLPIGVLNFSIDNIHSHNFKLKYQLKVFSTDDGFKKDFSYFGKLISNETQIRGYQKLYFDDHMSSSSEKKTIYSFENSKKLKRNENSSCLSRLITLPKKREEKDVFEKLPQAIFFKTSQKSEDILISFFSRALPKSQVKALYDRDNILKSARISLSNDMDLKLQRLSFNDFLDIKSALEANPFNQRWFKNLHSIDRELRQFQSVLSIYLQKISKLNQFIVRKMPELPYFTHRQLIFLSNFCQSLNKTLLKYKYHKGNINLTLNAIALQIKAFLSEIDFEPNQFLDFADLKAFSNKKASYFLLPRIVSAFLEKSTGEIQEYLNLEKTIKTRVRIALNIQEYPYKAVFRSYIKALDNFYQIQLKSKVNAKAQFSLKNLDDIKDSSINNLCKRQNGKIDIDIGSEFLEDNQDSHGKYSIGEQGFFIIKKNILKILSHHHCHVLSFTTNYDLNRETLTKFDTYKNIIIQPAQELKLSNRTTKYVRLSPGRYVMFVNSTKTGDLISKEVFTIPEAKRVRVAANIKLSDNRIVK